MAINNSNDKNNNTGGYNKKIRPALYLYSYEYISDLKKGHSLAIALF